MRSPNSSKPPIEEKSGAQGDQGGLYAIVAFCAVAVVVVYFLASVFFVFALGVK